MSIYTSLFIRRCFNTCVSLYSLVSLILLNRVTWLVLLFEFFSLSNGNGLGLSVRVKISTPASIHAYYILCLMCIKLEKTNGVLYFEFNFDTIRRTIILSLVAVCMMER